MMNQEQLRKKRERKAEKKRRRGDSNAKERARLIREEREAVKSAEMQNIYKNMEKFFK